MQAPFLLTNGCSGKTTDFALCSNTTHWWGCRTVIHVQKSLPACMHEGASSLREQDNMHRPLSSPALICLIWGLSSVSVTQYRHPCSLMALTGPGLTRKDRLSHVAGDAPLACCLSLNLTAVSWPPWGAASAPFLSMTPDARVQERYSYCSGWWVSGLISGFVGVSSLKSLSICVLSVWSKAESAF